MVGKSSDKEDKEAYQVCNEEDALIIWKSNCAFRKLGFFVENKGSVMHRTFSGA
ncbi:hypothetical protein [Bartonella sp. TS25HLJMH]|uniref:hypothetical protein n=1 Tax=Bartonella sp. TS25HLJMH TaxID=3243576 RepID=UPI0035D0F0E8